MSLSVGLLLTLAALAATLAALACLRMPSPLARLHAGSFAAFASTTPVVIAAFLSDGLTLRTGKCLIVLLLGIAGNAIATHAAGRAIHLREGARR